MNASPTPFYHWHLLSPGQCAPDGLRRLAEEGVSAVVLPITRTRTGLQTAIDAVQKVGMAVWGWIEIGRDEEAARANPEWMHAPQHHEWLQAFPDWQGGRTACVSPWVCVNNAETFRWALGKVMRLVQGYPGLDGYLLNDIQGAPAGCGCGNILCRSWDNSPGAKIAPTPYDHPEVFFTAEFLRACQEALPGQVFAPVVCGECEIGITMNGVESPDAVLGTCRGIPCSRPCALDYFPGLARALETEARVGLLTPYKLFGKDVPLYGGTAAWVKAAAAHYLELAPKTPLFVVVQGWDVTPEERATQIAQAEAGGARGVLVMETPLEQSWEPVAPPPGYAPVVPPVMCGG